jgi:hypothetical protein
MEFAPVPGAVIKTIAVIAPPEPTAFDVKRIDDANYVVSGLIGVARMKAEQEHMQQVSAALSASGEKFRIGLAERVADKLRSAGYEVVTEAGSWVAANGQLTLALEKVESTADAVLLLTPTTMGFVSTGGSMIGKCIPALLARVEMVGADRSRIIYRGFHAYGWIPTSPGLVSSPPVKGWTGTPAAKTFPSIEAVLKDIPSAIQQLYAAEDAIAAGIAADLPK